jgi:hypothetical protein
MKEFNCTPEDFRSLYWHHYITFMMLVGDAPFKVKRSELKQQIDKAASVAGYIIDDYVYITNIKR